jgi:hypothetical protein
MSEEIKKAAAPTPFSGPIPARVPGIGTTLGVDSAGTSTFVILGGVATAIDGPECTADTYEGTFLGDTYKQFGKGQIDGGNLTFTVLYDSTCSTLHVLALLLAQFAPMPNWQITYSDNTTETFQGHVIGMGRTVSEKDYNRVKITVRVSGNPGYKTS